MNDNVIVLFSVLPSVNGPTVIQEWKPVSRQSNYRRRAARTRQEQITIDLTVEEALPTTLPTPADTTLQVEAHPSKPTTSPPSTCHAEKTSHLDMPLLDEGDESEEVATLLEKIVNEALN